MDILVIVSADAKQTTSQMFENQLAVSAAIEFLIRGGESWPGFLLVDRPDRHPKDNARVCPFSDLSLFWNFLTFVGWSRRHLVPSYQGFS